MTITLTLAFAVKIFEGPVYAISNESRDELNDFRYLSNCMWYILVTMATVGYGDLYPKTLMGRAIGLMGAFTGTIFISLLIISLQNYLHLSTIQEKTVEFIERVKLKEDLKKQGSQYFIYYTLKYLSDKSKYMKEIHSPNQNKSLLAKLKKNLESSTYNRINSKKKFKRMIQYFINIYI
jgi:hypothetical protein